MPMITDVEYDAMSVHEREHIRKKLAESVGIPDCTYETSNEDAFRINFAYGDKRGWVEFPSKFGPDASPSYHAMVEDDLFQDGRTIPNEENALGSVIAHIKSRLTGIL